MNNSKRQSNLSNWLLYTLFAAVGTPAWAQLAPGGFTGAINSPTADVLNAGTASASLANSIPEKRRDNLGEGSFGSANLGFGVLPGLEIVGRVAYEGDLRCNFYDQNPPCTGMRDLSVSAKYQLPLRFGWDTRLAFGAVDVGGAATFFRSYYGVATSSIGAFDVSVGVGKGSHTYSTVDGPFGSTQVFLTDNWRVQAEYDSRELRAGMRYARPLTDQLSMELGASRKLSNRTDQQAWQAGLGLTFSFDKRNLNEGTRRGSVTQQVVESLAGAPVTAGATQAQAPLAVEASQEQAPATPAAALASAVDPALTQASRAETLAQRLRKGGFASVWVGFDDERSWVVQAEPLTWRKNRLDALGAALALWQKYARADEHVHLTLTYLQDPVLTASTSASCLAKFAEGGWWCDGQAAMKLDNGQSVRVPTQGWAIAPASNSRWDDLRPQFELGPVLRQHVGTEVGLYDASAGLDLGWEMALGRGMLWQGQITVPVVNTDNFASGKAFGTERLRGGVESTVISYQKQVGPRLWAQGSVGYVQHNDYGGQLDLAWLSPEGSLRLGAMGGYYAGKDASGLTSDTLTHPIGLATARWSAIDGRWMLEAQAGQFYNQDYGIRLASHHWFGDNRLTLHYRNTEYSSAIDTRRLQFAGFEISMPIGNRVATVVGPATVRGSDQWVYGLVTKVGGTDNAINTGYGVLPAIRHGLLSDTLDYDRAGVADMTANLYRVRAMLREMAGKP
jgi:hypothetical protein